VTKGKKRLLLDVKRTFCGVQTFFDTVPNRKGEGGGGKKRFLIVIEKKRKSCTECYARAREQQAS